MIWRGVEGRGYPGEGALPTFIIIGAQKCGTTGLHVYLSKHPEVSMSRPKELDFFIKRRTWGKGVDWYRTRFDASSPIRGEASPNYTSYPHRRGVAKRMHSVVPDVKLIYMVRDPIDRIASQWIHNYAQRRERGTLADTINHPRSTYISRSRYAYQLERFLKYYPREQILVLDQRDLRDNRHQLLRQVFEFIGADPDFTHESFSEVHHASSQKRRASKTAASLARLSRKYPQWLPNEAVWLGLDSRIPRRQPIPRQDVTGALTRESIELLRADAEELRRITGRDFAHWSIWEA